MDTTLLHAATMRVMNSCRSSADNAAELGYAGPIAADFCSAHLSDTTTNPIFAKPQQNHTQAIGQFRTHAQPMAPTKKTVCTIINQPGAVIGSAR